MMKKMGLPVDFDTTKVLPWDTSGYGLLRKLRDCSLNCTAYVETGRPLSRSARGHALCTLHGAICKALPGVSLRCIGMPGADRTSSHYYTPCAPQGKWVEGNDEDLRPDSVRVYHRHARTHADALECNIAMHARTHADAHHPKATRVILDRP